MSNLNRFMQVLKTKFQGMKTLLYSRLKIFLTVKLWIGLYMTSVLERQFYAWNYHKVTYRLNQNKAHLNSSLKKYTPAP